MGAYEYASTFGSSTELDRIAEPFEDFGIKSSAILIGHEYEIEWMDKKPFPTEDQRVNNAGEYEVMLSLVNEEGLRVNLFEEPQVMQISQVGYSLPVTFQAKHIGTWKLRIELSVDPNQFVETEEPFDIEFKDVATRFIGSQILPPEGAANGYPSGEASCAPNSYSPYPTGRVVAGMVPL
jgi:hypothetical protein